MSEPPARRKVKRPAFSPELRAHVLAKQAAANVDALLQAAVSVIAGRRVNRRRLRANIDAEIRRFRLAALVDDKSAGRRRHDALVNAHAAARQLLTVIDGPEGAFLRSRFVGGPGSDMSEALARFVLLTERALSSDAFSKDALMRLEQSPLSRLVGGLFGAFRKWLGSDAAYTRDVSGSEDGEARGPFIAFAGIVLLEAGIIKRDGSQYEWNTIAYLLSQHRTKRFRRAGT